MGEVIYWTVLSIVIICLLFEKQLKAFFDRF